MPPNVKTRVHTFGNRSAKLLKVLLKLFQRAAKRRKPLLETVAMRCQFLKVLLCHSQRLAKRLNIFVNLCNGWPDLSKFS